MSKLHDAVVEIIAATGRGTRMQLQDDGRPVQYSESPQPAATSAPSVPAAPVIPESHGDGHDHSHQSPQTGDVVGGFKVTSPYGKMRDVFNTGKAKPHGGTDIGTPAGTPVHAPFNGKITESRLSQSGGNMIILSDTSTDGTTHQVKVMHLQERHVAKGDSVRAGQVIGLTGNTGRSTAPHLHVEYLVNFTPQEPPRQILERVLRGAAREQ